MPVLQEIDLSATITWLGYVPHRDRPAVDGAAIAEMPLTLAGFADEVHAGLTRASCSRVINLHARDTEIRNTRQVTILGAEEIADIATALGLERLDPRWLGASVVVRGIPDLSHLPPGTRIQGGDGTTLTVDLANGPCQFPAMAIEAAHPGHGKRFKRAAEGRRGLTAWVERAGTLQLGGRLRLFLPSQRAWRGSACGNGVSDAAESVAD